MSLIGKNVEEQMWDFFMARVGNATAKSSTGNMQGQELSPRMEVIL